MPRYTLRRATLRDLDVLVRQRRRMWEDMGVTRGLDEADVVFRRWARARLRSGKLVGFLAEDGRGLVVAGGCVWLMVVHPRPGYPGGDQPYLLSFYTEPAHRGKGLARKVLRVCLAWCREQGYPRVTLHASAMGRPIYEQHGFERTWEMKLALRRGPTDGPPAARRAKPSR